MLRARRDTNVHAATAEEPHLSSGTSDQCVFSLERLNAHEARHTAVAQAWRAELPYNIVAFNVIGAGGEGNLKRSSLASFANSLENSCLIQPLLTLVPGLPK